MLGSGPRPCEDTEEGPFPASYLPHAKASHPQAPLGMRGAENGHGQPGRKGQGLQALRQSPECS